MDFRAFFVIKKFGKYDKTGPLTRPFLSSRRKNDKIKSIFKNTLQFYYIIPTVPKIDLHFTYCKIFCIEKDPT